ncbi:acyltransferase family protein [Paracraurococcus lichenis]|uniref:Acyltransferase n=1 Tax=Paracraurococcus lichenis TaxID=3064888 RepID=A0ABT9E029_9PROT|nr:acyltransferase [Paracraurococcus sp. LOR1-02]MDO9709517.1 acyltransferase [Paracraurococcus sp. LOR1-02]
MVDAGKRFEYAPSPAARSLPMEGLRGVAVLLVFLVHYCSGVQVYLSGKALMLADGIHLLGNVGVDLFFVLSGYLIYGALMRRPQPFADFMARRVRRLYPAFAVVMAAYLVLSHILPAESKLPSGGREAAAYILANLLLMPGIFPIQPIITVAWSLSYEMAFYVTLPALVGGLRLRAWPAPVRVAVFLAAVVLAQVMHLPHPRIGMFVCGMLLVEAMPALCAVAALRTRLDAAAIVAVPLCATALLYRSAGAFEALFLTCFLLCAAALAGRGPVARSLSMRPLRWLGNMSYSYYLLHGLMLKAMFFALSHLPVAQHLGNAALWVLLPPAFAVTVGGSVALFLTVEWPLSLRPRDATGPATPVAAATTSDASPEAIGPVLVRSRPGGLDASAEGSARLPSAPA